MKIYRDIFLTSIPEGREASALRPDRLIPRLKNSGTHIAEEWVGPTASLVVWGKRETCCFCRNSNPGLSSPYPCHDTDLANLAL